MKEVYIIAEAGVNHNGSLEIAKKLIDSASLAGVNAIKFQTFKAENLVSRNAKKADYQKKSTDKNESQYEMIKKLELDYESHKLLIEYAKSKNIDFLSSPFDLESIDLLESLGIEKYKIPSGEINNLRYLEKIGSLNKKVILSTGMSNLKEVETALNILIKSGTSKKNIVILHANTEYPTPMKDVNLKAMITIKEVLNVAIGYSDHTLGTEIPVAAVALGAEVIEKHFTLDKMMEGPDHKASLEPEELKNMVKAIRNIEISLGDGIKSPSESELRNIKIARKSIHVKNIIKKGEIIYENDLSILRPGDGISPMEIKQIIGKKAVKDLIAGEKLRWESIK